MNNRIISPLASFISTKTSLDFSNNFPNDLTITHSLNFLNPRIICDRSISSFFSFLPSIRSSTRFPYLESSSTRFYPIFLEEKRERTILPSYKCIYNSILLKSSSRQHEENSKLGRGRIPAIKSLNSRNFQL